MINPVGSGPFRFVASERIAGHRVVYERFAGYVPRPTGKTSFLAGPKIVHFDRVEWAILPDPATTAAALQSGEIDWWEVASADFVPVLRRDANLRISTSKLLTAIGIMRFNQLHPPFDSLAARRVMLNVVDQASFHSAICRSRQTAFSRARSGASYQACNSSSMRGDTDHPQGPSLPLPRNGNAPGGVNA
jgi:peptide/nickel transport system substrate-binding protein